MITPLILVENGPESLAATIAALMPAVVAGLVGDAVLITRSTDPDVAAIADGVGAMLVVADGSRDPWRDGAAAARAEWLLCLQDGDVPVPGWTRPVERFIASAGSGPRPVIGRMARRGAGPAARLRDMVEGWAGTATIRAGDLAPRALVLGEVRGRMRPVRIRAAIERDPLVG
jgi:hypothetical protein